MNDLLFTNNDGLRLITQFEGSPRLKARLCEGGAWELSYGCTFHPNGSPVQEGETCSEDYALVLFRNALGVFEDAVKRLVTVELNDNQFSALISFSYNVGAENLASSTVLRQVNARRFDDAADSFGMWLFATKGGYKQALRGLLRRRYAEACLFMSLDWTVACSDDAIALQKEKPAQLPGADRVVYKTPFRDVLAVAQSYPLTDDLLFDPAPVTHPEARGSVSEVGGSTPAQIPDQASARHPEPVEAARPGPLATQPAAPAPAVPEPRFESPEKGAAARTEAEGTLAAQARSGGERKATPIPAGQPVQSNPVGEAGSGSEPSKPRQTPPPILKPPSKFSVPIESAPYRIDPDLGLKPMEETERWQASIAQNGGKIMMRWARYGGFGSGPATVATFIEKDPLFAGAFVAVCGFAGLWAIGYVRKSYGDYCRHKAERVASQAMM